MQLLLRDGERRRESDDISVRRFGQQSVFFETQADFPRVEIWRVMIAKLCYRS